LAYLFVIDFIEVIVNAMHSGLKGVSQGFKRKQVTRFFIRIVFFYSVFLYPDNIFILRKKSKTDQLSIK